MLVRNNLENVNTTYANQAQLANDKKDIMAKQKMQESEQAAELTLSGRAKQVAEENAKSAESDIFDVSKAEEMIRQANQNILNQADDAIKVQSGQSVAVAIELLK